jgi:hypothetical protein
MGKTCNAIIKTGKNKGKTCTYKSKYFIHQKCGIHYKPPPKKIRRAPPPKITYVISNINGHGRMDVDICRRYHDIWYPNQDAIGKKIAKYFNSDRMNHRAAALCAPMQCGKTGAAQAVKVYLEEARSLRDKELITFILIPINDNDIKNQARVEFDRIGIPDDHIISLSDMMRDNKILSYLVDSYSHLDNVEFLYIVDESHMNIKVNIRDTTSIMECLKNVEVCMNARSIKDNSFLLTISATANAEIASISEQFIPLKAKFVLHSGQGYYSVGDMLMSNKVHDSWKLDDIGINKITNIINENYINQKKYGIIRIPCSSKHARDIGCILSAECNIKTIYYDSKCNKKQELKEILSARPDKFTVIFLINRARASLQLNTEHVSMVFENPNACIDTTAQGLPGRCCGYGKAAHKVDVYCDKSKLKVHSDWELCDYSKKSIPETLNTKGGLSVASKNNNSNKWIRNKPKTSKLSIVQTKMIKDMLPIGKKISSGFYNRHEPVLTLLKTKIFDKVKLDDQYRQPYKGNGLMLIISNSSHKKFWNTKNPKKMEHGFALDAADNDNINKKGFFMYIDCSDTTINQFKVRIYYTKRTLNDNTEKPSTVKEDCIYHKRY